MFLCYELNANKSQLIIEMVSVNLFTQISKVITTVIINQIKCNKELIDDVLKRN